jgi:4-hydroxy-3-polyprenylbenzoate decarboxylase
VSANAIEKQAAKNVKRFIKKDLGETNLQLFHVVLFNGRKIMIKIAVAVTGASGSIYAKVLLDQLQRLKDQVSEVSVVWSDNAFTVWQQELGNKDFEKFPFRVWEKNDFMAPFASGSSSYSALIICPCSMGTLGRIAGGISNDLVTRAADVMLKERRKLVCVVRETPYNLIHLRNMTTVTEAGGIICPATPSFYSKPQTHEDIAYTVIHRVLQLIGLNADGYRWGE